MFLPGQEGSDFGGELHVELDHVENGADFQVHADRDGLAGLFDRRELALIPTFLCITNK